MENISTVKIYSNDFGFSLMRDLGNDKVPAEKPLQSYPLALDDNVTSDRRWTDKRILVGKENQVDVKTVGFSSDSNI